ncbi:MAG: hypothetical protein ACI4B9_06360 [Eggerthellaceae bacterium]
MRATDTEHFEPNHFLLEFASRALCLAALIFLCLFLFGHDGQTHYPAAVVSCTTLSILFNIIGSHQSISNPTGRKDKVE